ncbi:MAG: hypothetical protein CMA27_05760 [Euryarchaeota archaeon]|nr:hypothetical protein [Euryarchaeota archaeon]|tara:strand:+ start:7152 stop:7421 length:270 start_codon:yes stop_codon:yes gene_type:complete
MANWWIEGIGIFAGILGIIAWFPQLNKIWIKKKAEGISLFAFSLIFWALCLWFIYGFLIGSPSLMISNGATLIMIFLVLVGSWKVQKDN